MGIANIVLPRRPRARGAVAVVAVGCLACGLAFAVPADAASDTLVPILDCATVSADGTTETAFFGYTSTFSSPVNVDVGPNNFFTPGALYRGQPTVFNPGNFPHEFATTFSLAAGQSILDWFLNGSDVRANEATPTCGSGTTSPASDVSDTAATLNGVIDPAGTDAAYAFEWGTTPGFGNSTAAADAGSGTTAVLVQAPLTGLSPSTTYYFRLDTTTSVTGSPVTSFGAQQQFTTAAAPVPTPTVTVTETPAPAPTVTVTETPAPAPTVTVTVTPPVMTLLTTSLPTGKVGVPYSTTLQASGGTTPYLWLVTGGFLPPGLRLDPKTGVLSGRPLKPCSFKVGITVTDSSGPARESLTEQYTITITR
jgi:hypothetical protein